MLHLRGGGVPPALSPEICLWAVFHQVIQTLRRELSVWIAYETLFQVFNMSSQLTVRSVFKTSFTVAIFFVLMNF